MRVLTCAFCLTATTAAAQVQVTARLEKPVYLAGEPIVVQIDLRNVGTEPFAYDRASGDVRLTVPNGTARRPTSLSPCGGAEVPGGALGLTTHPPLLKPGAVTTMRYLLRGYSLAPGSYEVQVAGKAGVRWTNYPDSFDRPGATRRRHAEGAPVEGADVQAVLPLTVTPSTQAELDAVFAPLLSAARESFYAEKSHEAREAILEMAPPFLEREIANQLRDGGHQRWIAERAASALSAINTVESRRALREAFDRASDLGIRASIANAIARTSHADNLEFLSSVLPGRSTELDDRVRRAALLGIGLIGGDEAVAALAAAPPSPNPLVVHALMTALGHTRARSAVPVLIDRARADNGYVRNEVCVALSTLTHFAWCDGSGDVAGMQARWRAWWAANGAAATIHSAAECPDLQKLPHIK